MSDNLTRYPESRDGDRVVRLCSKCGRNEADAPDGLCYACAEYDDGEEWEPDDWDEEPWTHEEGAA